MIDVGVVTVHRQIVATSATVGGVAGVTGVEMM